MITKVFELSQLEKVDYLRRCLEFKGLQTKLIFGMNL